MQATSKQPLQTKIGFDGGTLVHFIFGILAAVLRQEWLFTLIFLVKQLIDYHAGEDFGETSGDIAEYAAGLVVALLLLRLLSV